MSAVPAVFSRSRGGNVAVMMRGMARTRLRAVDGREEVVDGQAAVRPPRLRDGQHLGLTGQVVEPVDALDRLAERKIPRKHHVLAMQGDRQETLGGPTADPRNLGEARHDLLVWQPLELVGVEAAVDETSGQLAQRLHLATGEPGG